MLAVQTPWYADVMNYLAYGIMPYDFSNQQKRKLTTGSIFYIWDDPLLFEREAEIERENRDDVEIHQIQI